MGRDNIFAAPYDDILDSSRDSEVAVRKDSCLVSGAEETIYYESPVSPALLVNGTNVLAVEIHHVNATSTDISFDLELVANVRTAPAATEIVHNGGSYSLRWPSWAVGYRLYHADHLTPPINWVPVPAEPTNDGTWKTLTLPGSPTNGFYRVGW